MGTLKVNTVQDQDGNNIINESSNTVTVGKSGDTVQIASGASLTADSLTVNGGAVVAVTFPTYTSISPDTITNAATAITITGTGFVNGAVVEAVNSTGGITPADSVTFNSSTSISATFTLTTDGTYYIRIENPNGLAVRSTSADLTVSDAPTWSTGAGSLGSVAAGSSVSLSVSASSDSAVTISETTSVLTSNDDTPASTMNLSLATDGSITGTAPEPTSETTYNFTLRATDAESQTADRAFSITVTVGINNGGQFN